MGRRNFNSGITLAGDGPEGAAARKRSGCSVVARGSVRQHRGPPNNGRTKRLRGTVGWRRRDTEAVCSWARARRQKNRSALDWVWEVVLLAFTRALHACFVKQEYNKLCCRSIGYFALYLGCCYEHLGILFKDAIFHHFLFLALTLRLAPTLILPLPEFLDPPKMLGR